MSFGGESSDATIPAFKKFVSEDEIEEKRKQRQEEWEKVRKPEDPLDAPEAEIDNRCLYDKLQQQKQKKDDEYAEQHRLSNQVKGLDDDEAQFLDFVSDKKEEFNRRREEQESELLAEYRSAVLNQVTDHTSAAELKVKPGGKPAPSTQTGKRSQHALLAGAVKRKSQDGSQAALEKKLKTETPSSLDRVSDDNSTDVSLDDPSSATADPAHQVATVIGVLPGLGAYEHSSDSDNTSSSDSDIELPGDIFQKKIVIYHQAS